MGTQGTGRKRNPNKERTTAEDDALNLIAREAEARLAAKRAARAEAREIRMKELERQQKEISDDDERMSVGSRGSVRAEDRDYLEKGSRAASTLSTVTIASLGGTSSRRGSGDTAITADTEAASLREIKEIHELKDQIQDVESKYMQNLKGVKDALVEVEEKYRKAMVSNAQLDNEKGTLMYHVDTLKDSLMELEELLAEARRGHQDKAKDYEREKHAHEILQFHFNELKETLKQSEELLTEIRQLRMKEDGFNREISDLQETVEWKDKKIGALERQKEYSDAIRNERDELRDEVVQLKDVLKKHGIVIGETTTNGETAEAGTNGGDAASRLAQDSRAPPAEGNSILGGARETQTESTGGAELGRAESRQRQQIQEEEEEEEEEEGQEDRLTPPDHSSLASVPETEPPREKQTGSKIEGDASKDLDNDFAIVEVIKSVGSSEVQVIVTGPGDEIKAEREGCKAAGPEGGDVGELGSASAGEDGAGSNQVKVDDLETAVGKSSSDLNDEPSPKKPTADEDTSQQEPRDTENAEDKKTEEPSPEEPLLEEPSSENRSPEEPSLEEPLQEEPSLQEPSLEEPSLEEPSSEKPSPEEPPLEEPLQEEPSPEEPSPQEPSLEEPSSEKPLPEEHSPELAFSQSQPQGGSTPSKKKKKKKRAKKKKGAQGDGTQEDDTKTKRKNPAGPVAPATREEEEPGKETGVETQRSPMEILRESNTAQAKDQSPVIENDHMPIQVSCSESDSGVCNPSDDPKCRTSPDDPNVEPEPPTKTDGIQINSESSESNDVLKDNSEPTSKADNVADESQQTRNTGALGDTSEFRTNTENEGEFESQTKTETSQSTANGDSLDCSDIHTGCTTKSDSFVDFPETPVDLKCQSTSIISDGVKEEEAIAVSEPSATAKTIKQEPGVDCHSSDMLSPELEENVEHKDLIHTVVQVSISPDHFSAKATEDLEEMVQGEINWRDKEPGIDNDDKLPEDSDKCCDTSLDSNCVVETISKDEQSVDRSDCLPDNKLLNEVCEAEGVDAAPMAACLTEQVHVESGSGTEGYSDPSSRATIEVARPSLPLGEEQEDSGTNQQDNELKPIRQLSEEEEEENEEGQSFDFDDVDSEVFGDVPKTHQGNAEQGLETESKEDDGSTMQHSPINTIKEEEPDEDMGAQLLTQEEPNKSRKGCVWDRLTEQKDPAVEASETEAAEEDVDGTPDEHQSPNEKEQSAVVDVCNQSEGQLASVAEGGASLAHGQRELSGEGLELTVGQQQSIAEGESVQTRAQAGLGEEGPVDNGFRGERLSSQKAEDQGGENDERSRKGSKSNSKKGKGKGKDDCKMT